MSELTLERLSELRRIAQMATPGPWAVNPFKATVDEMPRMLPSWGWRGCLSRECRVCGIW